MNTMDGFVIPVPDSSREAYLELARTVAAIFVERAPQCRSSASR